MKELSPLIEEAREVSDRSNSEENDDEKVAGSDASTISSISSYSSVSEEEEQNKSSKDLAAYIQGLFDHSPAIENNLIRVEQKLRNADNPPPSIFGVSKPAQTYVSLVRDKFPKVL